MDLRSCKQLAAQAAAAGMGQHRDAELGAGLRMAVFGVGQMRHGDQAQAPVKDAKNLVFDKVEPLNIGLNLGVLSGVSKAQIAIFGGQLQ